MQANRILYRQENHVWKMHLNWSTSMRILSRLSATSTPPSLVEASQQNARWLSRRSYCSASKIIELSALNCEIFRDIKRCRATSNLFGCPHWLQRMIWNLSETNIFMTLHLKSWLWLCFSIISQKKAKLAALIIFLTASSTFEDWEVKVISPFWRPTTLKTFWSLTSFSLTFERTLVT